MGIPHLTTHLQPFGSNCALSDASLVIDGPSFAYHVYHICSVSQPNQPSYKCLGRCAIAWLEDLATSGANISAIYFDGYLPESKKPVRLDRLLKTSQQLQNLYSAHPDHIPERQVLEVDVIAPGDSSQKRTATTKFTARKTSNHHPAFLVPAIIDSLKRSPRFKELLWLVPGEADAYCAQHALRHGDSVLTSDSDLILHDLGEQGSVIFFRDIQPVESTESSVGSLQSFASTVTRYSPAGIAERLKLASKDELLRFAFELSMDGHASRAQLLEACRKPCSHARLFREFCLPYKAIGDEALAAAKVFSERGGNLLDPRLSELALGSDVYRMELSGLPSPPGKDRAVLPSAERLVFLPVLLDCPGRTSAWESSTLIRRLAYSALQLHFPQRFCVREFRRIQSVANKGSKVGLPDETMDWAAFTAHLRKLIDTIHHCKSSLKQSEEVWCALALLQDIDLSEETGKDSSMLKTLREIWSKTKLGSRATTSWAMVHFTAQLQATYYSLRMLSQVLSVVSVASVQVPPQVKELLARCQEYLSALPALEDFPTVHGTTALIDKMRIGYPLGRFAGMTLSSELSWESMFGLDVEIQGEDPNGQVESRKKRKRRKKQQQEQAASEPKPKTLKSSTSNPFDILGSD